MGRLGRAALAGFIVLLAFVGPATAATPAPLDLPDPVPGRAVYDLAAIWSPDTVAAAEREVDALTTATKTPVVVVSRPTGLDAVSEAQAIGDASLIMRRWEVGNPGRNDGLVVLFDLDTTLRHGQIRIYPGYDLEASALPPDLAQAIFEESMVGPAVDGDLDTALLAGLSRIDETIRASLGAPAATDTTGGIVPGPGEVTKPGDIPAVEIPDPGDQVTPPAAGVFDAGGAFGGLVVVVLFATVIGAAVAGMTGRAGAARRGRGGVGTGAGFFLWGGGHDRHDGGSGGFGGVGGGDGGGIGGGGGGGADGGSGGGGGGF